MNGFDWLPPVGDDQDGEETYQLMLAIAARSSARGHPVEDAISRHLT